MKDATFPIVSIIPEHTVGKQTDLEQTATLPTAEAATDCFKRAYKRLLNPPVWHEISGKLSASFMLAGKAGYELDRLAQENDYIRIDLHTPGNAAGEGYDWVKIEAMQYLSGPNDTEELFGMRVRPCANPADEGSDTAHFFKSTATSTFIIHRQGNTVTASYHGRNEQTNSDTGNTTDNIRNTAVAAAAKAGKSELQWMALIKGLLQAEL
jgi:hypothetical protein